MVNFPANDIAGSGSLKQVTGATYVAGDNYTYSFYVGVPLTSQAWAAGSTVEAYFVEGPSGVQDGLPGPIALTIPTPGHWLLETINLSSAQLAASAATGQDIGVFFFVSSAGGNSPVELDSDATPPPVTLTLDNDTVTNTAFTNYGAIKIDAGDTVTFAGTDTINGGIVTNTGTLQTNGALTIDSNVSVNNSGGTIVAESGSTVVIDGIISGGNAIINNGMLTYGGGSNVATSFDGLGTLVVASNQFTGTVFDFEKGDIIDLAEIPFHATGSSRTHLTYSASLDTLTVSDGSSGPSTTIQLAGSYSASNFVLSQDSGTGTEVTLGSGEGPEPPTLSIGGTKVTVNEGSTVVLPTINVTPVELRRYADSDDHRTTAGSHHHKFER